MTRSWLWGLGLSSGAHLVLVALVLWRLPPVPAAPVPVTAVETPRSPGTLFRVAMRDRSRPSVPEARSTIAGTRIAPPAEPVRAERRGESSEQEPVRPSGAEDPPRNRSDSVEPPALDAARAERSRSFDRSSDRVSAPEPARDAVAPSAEPGALSPSAASAAPADGTPSVAPGSSDSSGRCAAPGSSTATGSGTPTWETDSTTLASVHERLASAAKACAPAAARRFRLEGLVGVRFCVDPSGAASGVQIEQPSGQALLDDATRNCVVPTAAPFPDRARGRCFDVPVRFTLPR